ncbi:glycerophosphodiester phosphodiesterase GDPDL1-like [Rhododendron vialii]|uniref:glycerophosphodiester phosphodiesterase GDPDL1-like n=1 Tax=Rhododendron vialii TaxID=182163 RepID=UPI00265E86B4|nr:glycerophosphodiester phosphodiesterase GDPDL1-like [Rhododendron vialii]XP_058194521.1 glycerophosphodiester phosphodiesterase GDPDL1-like [Rhododendron vialii]
MSRIGPKSNEVGYGGELNPKESQGEKTDNHQFAFVGNAPLVIAHGGFSRLFPDSSEAAYQIIGQVSLANVIFWCDVQLTKDAAGVCAPNLNLANNTDISSIFPNQSNTYSVNGVSIQGWFSVDFTQGTCKCKFP